jgi:predicted ABC-type ATPase
MLDSFSMPLKRSKKILEILAGPNGCGKSTLSDLLLSHRGSLAFINADVIARGLNASGGTEIESGRIMIDRIRTALNDGESFAFETTLAGRAWMKLIKTAQARGYEVIIYYVLLRDAEQAKERVLERVKQGGHSIPPNVISRRYTRSKQMFTTTYSKMADRWYVFDNSEKNAKLVASSEDGQVNLIDKETYFKLLDNLS